LDNWLNKGFFSHGVLNLTPKESFELSKQGAFIVDVREDYLNAFKMFEVENVVYLPYSKSEEHYHNLPTDINYRLSGSCLCQLKAREKR